MAGDEEGPVQDYGNSVSQTETGRMKSTVQETA